MKHWQDLAAIVEDHFSRMSAESQTYQSQTGVKCVSNCGRCCLNPSVEAAPIEMLPLALSLLSRPDIEVLLSTLATQKTCAFYQDQGVAGKCGAYQSRPVICRLFGWAKIHGKQGPRLSVCQFIDAPNLPTESAPHLPQWSDTVRSLVPELSQLMPINEALRWMLEKLLLEQQFRPQPDVAAAK